VRAAARWPERSRFLAATGGTAVSSPQDAVARRSLTVTGAVGLVLTRYAVGRSARAGAGTRWPASPTAKRRSCRSRMVLGAMSDPRFHDDELALTPDDTLLLYGRCDGGAHADRPLRNFKGYGRSAAVPRPPSRRSRRLRVVQRARRSRAHGLRRHRGAGPRVHVIARAARVEAAWTTVARGLSAVGPVWTTVRLVSGRSFDLSSYRANGVRPPDGGGGA
jgi:hypothetical protein